MLGLRRRDDLDVCTCTHARVAHQHYRRGTDCSGCRCARFAVTAGRRQAPATIDLRPLAETGRYAA